ncbi:MAG: winged helix-turn-helix domain-containing protein [Candidatus Bathyarchaeota archaeon]
MENSALQGLWKRRDRLQLMAEIMEAAKEKQLKTRIMYMVNLSFSQLNEYLEFLTKTGFLRFYSEDKRKVYETTTKGNQYIKNYIEMSNWLQIQNLEDLKVTER